MGFALIQDIKKINIQLSDFGKLTFFIFNNKLVTNNEKQEAF